MTLEACAELVRKADPDRFRAAMATSVKARQILFPIYAFNIEVARAPWAATSEPLLAEMRLQWWKDALDEIASGAGVRRHEVVTPLSEILDPEAAATLSDLVDARRWDVANEHHVTVVAMMDYIDRTAGNLMWAGARLLGADADDEETVRDLARGLGLVRYFAAVPTLEARGRHPLPLGINIGTLAETVLDDMPEDPIRKLMPRPARYALYDATGADTALAAIAKTPSKVHRGHAGLPGLSRRFGLIMRSYGR